MTGTTRSRLHIRSRANTRLRFRHRATRARLLAAGAALLATLTLATAPTTAIAAGASSSGNSNGRSGPEVFAPKPAQQGLQAQDQTAAAAATVPASFEDQTVFSGLTEPADVAFASDGRVFVAEKSGLVKVFASTSATTPTTFVDLRTQVHNFWDRGLLGLALAPNFPTDPSVYVLYAYDAPPGKSAPYWGTAGATGDGCPSPPGAQTYGCVITGRLSKFTATGNTAGPEQVLITDWCQQFPSHSIGSLAFGPDGYLYASAGDGASFDWADYGQTGASGPIAGKDPIPANPCGDAPSAVGTALTAPTAEGGALRAQDMRTTGDPAALNGSVIRIDPNTGAGAPGNPFASSSDANARRILAYGMRNPFRIGFRPGTSELWVGDVGWGTWEEVNRITTTSSATNFGWPCYEGNARQSGYESNNLNLCANLYAAGAGAVKAPHYTYNHGSAVVAGDGCPTANGSAISGIAFAPTTNYPSQYQKALFFADHSRRCVWSMGADANGVPDPTKISVFATGVNPVALKTGPDGDVYYVDYEGGRIARFHYTGNRPVARVTANPTNGTVPLTVAFDGSTSSDPDAGQTLTYAWDFDRNGTVDSTAAAPSFTYTTPGTYHPSLTVTDPTGLTGTAEVTVVAGNSPPTAVVDTPAASLTWKVGDPIPYSGHATDLQDGNLPASALHWQFVMHHCTTPSTCHEHIITTVDGVASGTFTAVDHEYPSWLEVRLTAQDSGGLTGTASVRLDPKTADLTLTSTPVPGLTLGLNSASGAAPLTKTLIVNGTASVAAPSPQTVGGKTYEFVSWSDGGAQSHNVTMPAANTTLTATYREVAAPTGLVAAYGFNEGAGATANDASGKGNTGTAANTAWTAGKYGQALSFNGTSSWVTVPNSSTLAMTNKLTLEAWVRPATVSGWRNVILKQRGTDGLSYGLYASGDDRAAGYVRIGATDESIGATANLPVNTWSHIAVTYDGATLRFYVNGTQVASRAQTGNITGGTDVLRIGGNSVWGEYFSGLIDEVRIYNRTLTQAEVTTDMNTPL
ncbi:LamG-like jellyroll fold domain-containing protein [Yinghuangia seranimata]|uniref:LamG-like jellyroll fold domain-containing protein n=1 Tax=Yinghuangia seranimata TaxID=408067 RepID=UPI00248C1975|nr:LamG-like jellyroll fold domain-containing protein [Yinghuangia seranimata]MDI2128180.1 PQQ-dependent sugar dehydrogenase [Yinghuangia seranimata]